jgi:aldehyde dehydrogenase (NAD+)
VEPATVIFAHPFLQIHARLHKTFASGITRPLEWRRQQLNQLVLMFQENKKAIEHALWQDLRKPDQESALIEVAGVIGNARIALDNLEKWTAPVRPEVHPSHSNWNPTVHQVPKGVILVISYVPIFRHLRYAYLSFIVHGTIPSR